MDEEMPHIHATVVPIVIGERRKTKATKKNNDKPEQGAPTPDSPENGKKKSYRKKDPNAARLYADDIVTRENLELFQDTYAEKINKYGLQRGIKGSDARHITTPQYYRDLYEQNKGLKEDIEYLQDQKQEVYDSIRDLYDRKDKAREKFLNMHEYTQQKENEISAMESRLKQLRQDYEPYKAQDDLKLLMGVLPKLGGQLRIARYCTDIGLTTDTTQKLLTGEQILFTCKLRSPEHDRDFSVQDAKLQIFQEKANPDKLKLKLNGQNIIDWFKGQFRKLQQIIKPHIKLPTKPDNK